MKFFYTKKLFILSTLLIILSFLITNTHQQDKTDSSLVFYLNEFGIKSVQKSILPAIFNNHPIPLPSPGAWEQTIDFIGRLKLNITELSIIFDNISDDQINLEFKESNNINLTINNISGNLNFTYDFQSGFYNNKASGKINITGMGVEISSNITSIQNLHDPKKLGPNLQINYLNVPVTPALSIYFDNPGRFEYLVKFFFDLISNSISQTIVDNLKKNKIEDLNKNISLYTSNLELSGSFQNVTVDYSLNSPPVIKNNVLEVAFNTTLSSDDKYTYSGPKYNMPHVFKADAPLYGLLNQYIIDGFFNIMQHENRLCGYIPSEAVDNPNLKLDVNGLSAFFSNLSKVYNPSDLVDLNITSSDVPILKFRDEKLSAEFNFTINFIVREKQKGINTSAILSNMKVKTDLKFTIKNAKLEITISSLEFAEIKILRSEIGKINAEELKSSLNLKINFILMIYSSFKFDLGIYLPKIAGISFNQTSIIPHEGYLEFGVIPIPDKRYNHFFLDDKNLNNLFQIGQETFKSLKKQFDKQDSKNLKFLN